VTTSSLPGTRAVTLLAACFLAVAPLAAGSLDDALARLDRSAASFRGLTASIKKVSYTALIKESSEESGRITLYRAKPRDLRMLVEFTEPAQRAVAFQNHKAQVYSPRLQLVQDYDFGKQAALVDQFLLLGFGTSSTELRRNYDIRYGAEETLRGVRADRLEFTPKSGEAQKQVKLVEIWVSHEDGIVVQQKIHQPSRDYVLISYSDIKLNPKMTASSVVLKLPKGVKRESPQR
jgi:outer membrane lipoprotein-sorting protein